MATLIQFKRSSTQNDTPSVSDLSLGEFSSTLIMVDSTLRRMMVLLL